MEAAINSPAKKFKQLKLNKQIRASQVRLIDQDGVQLGIVPFDDALDKASQLGLDLVEMSPDAEPVVCKIMDYSKHLFDEKKKSSLAKKKQKQVQLKEMKFRLGIDIADYQVKLKKMIEFLQDGNKAKVSLRFRGREFAYKEKGEELFLRIQDDLKEHGQPDGEIDVLGKQMSLIFFPHKH